MDICKVKWLLSITRGNLNKKQSKQSLENDTNTVEQFPSHQKQINPKWKCKLLNLKMQK